MTHFPTSGVYLLRTKDREIPGIRSLQVLDLIYSHAYTNTLMNRHTHTHTHTHTNV